MAPTLILEFHHRQNQQESAKGQVPALLSSPHVLPIPASYYPVLDKGAGAHFTPHPQLTFLFRVERF